MQLTAFFTRPLTNKTVPPSPVELRHLDELRLEELRAADRANKARYDAAYVKRIEYERTHPILDAITIIKGNAFKRVAASQEHPVHAQLCYDENAEKQRWYAGRKAVSDEEFRQGVKK